MLISEEPKRYILQGVPYFTLMGDLIVDFCGLLWFSSWVAVALAWVVYTCAASRLAVARLPAWLDTYRLEQSWLIAPRLREPKSIEP